MGIGSHIREISCGFFVFRLFLSDESGQGDDVGHNGLLACSAITVGRHVGYSGDRKVGGRRVEWSSTQKAEENEGMVAN